MKLKKKITSKQYLRYKLWAYAVIGALTLISAYCDYQHWLNPLDLKLEHDPKQHDGSQEFQRPIDFESAIQPAPDEDGTTRYLGPNELEALDGLAREIPEISPEDQQILDELGNKEDYTQEIVVDQ
jgi:hypothetical protein